MTFTALQTEIAARLNLSSTEALARIGREINYYYRRVTSSLGLAPSRRGTVQASATIGITSLTFTSVEKLFDVFDRTTSPHTALKEVSVEEIRMDEDTGLTTPSRFAILTTANNSVTILMDCIPQTAFTLYADALQTTADLSGTNAPSFAESFHDILIYGPLADEYRKIMKPDLARESERQFEARLSDLRMFLAKSAYQDIYPGKTKSRMLGASGSSAGASGVPNGALSWTQTGLITFDRDPLAPFAVSSGSAVVANLDADKLDGLDSTAFRLASAPINDSDVTFTDITTGNVTSTKHGFTPKSPADATKFLNGAATPAFALVKDSDLSTSDITTNDFSTSKHGFAPKGSTDTAKFLRADGSYAEAFPQLTQGRLTLTSGTPVTTSDVTGAATIYFTPYGGNRIALFDGTNWKLYTFTEKSVALGTITNDLPYDVFIYDNSGTLTLEILAWSSKTARATALAVQDGVYVKTGATTRKYLGTFHTTATTTTEDSFTKRLLWNYYNRVLRILRLLPTTDTWTYTTNTYRQANADTANQVSTVVGVAEVALSLDLAVIVSNNGSNATTYVAIGEGSTTTPATGCRMSPVFVSIVSGAYLSNTARLDKYPAVGYQFWTWLEKSVATGITTWRGDGGSTDEQSGLVGSILG